METWGIASSQALVGDAGVHTCPTCGQRASRWIVVSYRYFHIARVFSFLIGRTYFAICDSCTSGVRISPADTGLKLSNRAIPLRYRHGWLFTIAAIGTLAASIIVSSHLTRPSPNADIAPVSVRGITNS